MEVIVGRKRDLNQIDPNLHRAFAADRATAPSSTSTWSEKASVDRHQICQRYQRCSEGESQSPARPSWR